MISALFSALSTRSVSAVLLAVGVGVAFVSRGPIDLEAIEAAARQPAPQSPVELSGFRFPAPDEYPLLGKPWIKSRGDLIAYYTRGEDPDLVQRYSEGPEEELIDYLGEVFARAGYPYQGEPPSRSGSVESSTPGDDLVLRSLVGPSFGVGLRRSRAPVPSGFDGRSRRPITEERGRGEALSGPPLCRLGGHVHSRANGGAHPGREGDRDRIPNDPRVGRYHGRERQPPPGIYRPFPRIVTTLPVEYGRCGPEGYEDHHQIGDDALPWPGNDP